MDHTPQNDSQTKPRSGRWRWLLGIILWVGVVYFAYVATRIDFLTLRVMPYLGLLFFLVAALAHTMASCLSHLTSSNLRRGVKILKWPAAIVLAVFAFRGLEGWVMHRYLQSIDTQLAPLTALLHTNKSSTDQAVAESLHGVVRIKRLHVLVSDDGFSIEVMVPAIDIDGYVAFYVDVTRQWYYYHNDLPDQIRPADAGPSARPIAHAQIRRALHCVFEQQWRCEQGK